MRGLAWWAWVLCALGLGVPGVGGAWGQEVVQRPQGNVVLPGVGGAPEGAAPDEGPDERPLWRLLSAGDYETLEGRIARLRAAYPGWSPPGPMLALVGENAAERAFAAAKARRDWEAVRRMAAARPGLASCRRPDDAAVVAAAPGAPSTLEQAVAACPDDAARVALLAAAADRFGAGPVLPLLARIGVAGLPGDARRRRDAVTAEAAYQRLGEALQAGGVDGLAQGEALQGTVVARRDTGMAVGLGYAALKAGQAGVAVGWFELARQWDATAGGEGLVRAYMAAGRDEAARGEAARLMLVEDGGGAGTALVAEIDAARVAAAYQRGAFGEVVALSAGQADPPVTLGWSLYRLRRFDAAAAAFERRYARHREAAAAEGVVLSLAAAGRGARAGAAAARYGGAALEAWRRIEAAQEGGVAPGERAYQAGLQRLRAGLAAHDPGVPELAKDLAPEVEARGDAGAAVSLGWAAFGAGRMGEAARWFGMGARSGDAGVRDDGAYGAALVAFKEGEPGVADVAAAHVDGARWRQLRVDALMQQAQREAAAAPEGVAGPALAEEALRLEPGRRDAAMLLAWSRFHRGDRAAAAAAFESLYRAAPDADAATGLATAEADAGRLAGLATALGGPLRDAAAKVAATAAFSRKDFLSAARIDPGLSPGLANVDAPTFGWSTTYRSKSGGAGTSRLDSVTGDVFGSVTQGLDRVTVRLHLVSLDAGAAPATAGAVARMTTRLPLGVEPVVAWERQPAGAPLVSLAGELGLTPLGGVVDPTVTGRAVVAWQGAATTVRATAYRQAVTESVLSFTGITDPATGRQFGRVVESGGRVEAYQQLGPRWGVYGQGGAGVRDGRDVRANLHVQGAATLAYDLRPAGFDSLTVGPSYQFAHFDRDLSGFLPGQGGYYSPAASHTVGAALRMLTAEARDFVVRGSAFLGYQFARSDGAVYGVGARGAASRQDGLNTVGEVTAGYRLTDRLILGGIVRYQVSPQYSDLYVGASLTVSFGARAALLSSDLPRFDLR